MRRIILIFRGFREVTLVRSADDLSDWLDVFDSNKFLVKS
jgi:hypothetical protein